MLLHVLSLVQLLICRGWDDKLADEAGSAGTNKHGLDLGDLPSAQITAVTHDSSDDE